MDLDLKRWEHHHQQQQQGQDDDDESEDQQEHTPAKLPKLPLPPPHPQLNTNIITQNNNDYNNNNSNKDHPPPVRSSSSVGSTLPLFVPDHPSPPTKTHPFPRTWTYFSMAQWQELELQALIYRYMLFGAAVPPELLHSIKNSLVRQPSSSHHQSHLECFLHYPQSQPFRFQASYWGSASTDQEPGRCRRTDGKKWRCSRDVVQGHKYCERHVHRGRNRSRKPVEIPPTPVTLAAASPTSGSIGFINSGYPKSNTNSVTVAATVESRFAVSGTSGHSPIDLFQMNKSQSGPIPEFLARNDSSRGQVLRHFLDDCPRPLQEYDVAPSIDRSMLTARNSSSDVSLKLSTGDGEQSGAVYGYSHRSGMQQGSNRSAGWSPNRVVSMGGPLAEALSSSVATNHSLPTGVLHGRTCGLSSETSLIAQV